MTRSLTLGAALAAILGFIAPAAHAQDRARAKEVVVALAAEPRSLLPNTIVDWTTHTQLEQIYDRLVKAHGADALSPLAGTSCAACYTDLTPQGYNDMRAGRLVVCKNCGKLLYLAE